MTSTDTTPLFTVQQAIEFAQAQFGLPRLDAQMLLSHACGLPIHDRAWLLAHCDEVLSFETQARYLDLLQRRAGLEPLAYITGVKEFFGLQLHIDNRVLDPRPETETLVEWALTCVADTSRPQIADLGTGSGAIALAIKYSRPDALVTAADASADAIAVATANAQSLGLEIATYVGNWCAPLTDQSFDLIVSNPPYVAEGNAHLAQLPHEPIAALVAGKDGLDDLRQIVVQATEHLKPGAWLLLEHGFDQAQAVQELLGNQGFVSVQSRPDLAGILRCTGGQWPRVK
ncbi:MAG: peptide chain release factor N(5)-glutamine methyltransferase [Burkholderiales bacterium]|nr:peptide chain release factor N(5)-glutamine methyltransferase [Burkholderiales bacterium]